MQTGLGDIASFVIGDAGYASLYAGKAVVQKVGAAAPATARTLVREGDGGRLRLSLYLPDRLVENLERHDPSRVLSDDNVDDFATFVEEIDHVLCIADRHRAGGETSLLELELHANVTKSLVLQHFIGRLEHRSTLMAAERAWVKHHVFDKNEFVEEDEDVRGRYRDASSLAVKYLAYLGGLVPSERPAELRRFHRRTHHEKIAHIERHA